MTYVFSPLSFLRTSGVLFLTISIFFAACTGCGSDPKPPPPPPKPKVEVPKFDANNAYQNIQKQVDFGFRIPGTPEHAQCAQWLESELKKYADETIVQKDSVEMHTGKRVPMYNIVGSFNPASKDRILLCAHWDTRPIADQDEDEKKQADPIVGANDGGSGVGVLLEIARVLKENPVQIGVDIILFDVEDSGESNVNDSYCLGSQYWADQPHKKGYKADFGILLDMVGASDAVFNMEAYSLRLAPRILEKVWDRAHHLGYATYFPAVQGSGIVDDHIFVNKAGIPTIDIIHNYPQAQNQTFGSFWHTHDDDMDIISKSTLKVVGHVVLDVIYRENHEL